MSSYITPPLSLHQASSQYNMNSSLTTADRAIVASLDPCDARDVRLYAYSRRTTSPGSQAVKIDKPLPIVAMSSVLNQAEHFSTCKWYCLAAQHLVLIHIMCHPVLTAGFAEAGGNALSCCHPEEIAQLQAEEFEYDYECDSDLDEAEAGEDKDSASLSTGSDCTPDPKGKQKDMTGVELPQPLRYTVLVRNIAFKT